MMTEPKYAFIEPGRDRRNRRQELKDLLRGEASDERARALADLARRFHEHRELNLAMDAAGHVLAGEGGVAFLVAAYVSAGRADLEIDQIAMLNDLARWLGDAGLIAIARPMAYDRALDWCGRCDGRERERRLDTLRRRFDDELADQIDVALY